MYVRWNCLCKSLSPVCYKQGKKFVTANLFMLLSSPTMYMFPPMPETLIQRIVTPKSGKIPQVNPSSPCGLEQKIDKRSVRLHSMEIN